MRRTILLSVSSAALAAGLLTTPAADAATRSTIDFTDHRVGLDSSSVTTNLAECPTAVAVDRAGLQQPVQPVLDRSPRDPQRVRQLGQRRPPVRPKGRDDAAIEVVGYVFRDSHNTILMPDCSNTLQEITKIERF